jgi:DNA-binding CsgD family transcriptional regulator
MESGDGNDVPQVADSGFGSQEVLHVRAVFEASQHPMLISDDHRRWVTGNAPAQQLLGLSPTDFPWRTMDEFTPSDERERLDAQWAAFLATGEAGGWYHLHVPTRGSMLFEFGASANVMPGRHLAVFVPPDEASAEQASEAMSLGTTWMIAEARSGREALSDREREILGCVASGLQGADIAERLFISSETVKSHVQNAMTKLGARTRAHAVAVALVTGEITWETS